MPTPEEKYYDSMNTLLAPVRWAKSLVQTVLLIGIVIFIGLAYPLILLANHMPIGFSAMMVPFMTVLTIFTFCYAPYYFLFGGAVFAVAWATAVIQIDGFPISLGANEAFGFIFLAVGILQRYTRRRSSAAREESEQKEPEPKKLSFAEMVEEARLERRQREYDALSPEDRAAKTRRFGEDYFNWPDKFKKGSGSGTAAEDDNDFSKYYTTLGVRNYATPEEVKQAYRDLTKVWHPDRFDDGDTRLKQKAEEQLKVINDAYPRIQVAHKCINHR